MAKRQPTTVLSDPSIHECFPEVLPHDLDRHHATRSSVAKPFWNIVLEDFGALRGLSLLLETVALVELMHHWNPEIATFAFMADSLGLTKMRS